MEPSDPPQEKKIIVDEDWKSQVQAEKEAAKQSQEETPETSRPREPLPPASLTFLATTLAMQAMVGMGMIANPATGKAEPELEQAKHLIDTLGVLWDKTQGNRTPEESATLERLLHELRMGYVAVQGRPAPGATGG